MVTLAKSFADGAMYVSIGWPSGCGSGGCCRCCCCCCCCCCCAMRSARRLGGLISCSELNTWMDCTTAASARGGAMRGRGGIVLVSDDGGRAASPRVVCMCVGGQWRRWCVDPQAPSTAAATARHTRPGRHGRQRRHERRGFGRLGCGSLALMEVAGNLLTLLHHIPLDCLERARDRAQACPSQPHARTHTKR
jgi:hypothetical protein